MEHLEWHNHAYIDESNTVIAVAVFQEKDHDSDLLEEIRKVHNAKQTICCCTFGLANVGDVWDGEYFKPAQPYPEAVWNETTKKWEDINPIVPPPGTPEDAMYLFDPNTKTWSFVSPSGS